MLKECLEIFKGEYEKKGEGYITDNYKLGEGSYILVDENGNIEEKLEIDKNYDDKNSKIYEYFAQRDYLSNINMQKPIDTKKVIHSNNYLTFFIKKGSINSTKLTDEIINNYYKFLIDPREKYKKDKKKRQIYGEAEKKFGKADVEELEKCKKWIKDNIYLICPKVKKDENYLKVFFKQDINVYINESEKYILPNIYNKNDFNVCIKDKIYGLHDNNMGSGDKKPYLLNKSRKNSMPYLISNDEVILQKKFFDLLMNYAAKGDYNIYLKEGSIATKPSEEFSGFFLRIKKGKEVEIHDFDVITSFNQKFKELNVKNVIPISYGTLKQTLKYGNVKNVEGLKILVNEVYFNKFLASNYFTEPKDIKLNNSRVKENLLKSRNAFFSWFYKGNETIIRQIFGQVSLDLIKDSICRGYLIKAGEQFNLRCALIEYFKGGESMADVLSDVVDTLREKINSNSTGKLESDKEYYFSVGQVVSYLISLNKSNKKMHSLINPILNCRSDNRLKQEIEKLFKKYNYIIKKENKRFNNLLAMVLSYEPKDQVISEVLIAGYLYSNLIYEKKEGEN